MDENHREFLKKWYLKTLNPYFNENFPGQDLQMKPFGADSLMFGYGLENVNIFHLKHGGLKHTSLFFTLRFNHEKTKIINLKIHKNEVLDRIPSYVFHSLVECLKENNYEGYAKVWEPSTGGVVSQCIPGQMKGLGDLFEKGVDTLGQFLEEMPMARICYDDIADEFHLEWSSYSYENQLIYQVLNEEISIKAMETSMTVAFSEIKNLAKELLDMEEEIKKLYNELKKFVPELSGIRGKLKWKSHVFITNITVVQAEIFKYKCIFEGEELVHESACILLEMIKKRWEPFYKKKRLLTVFH